MFFLRMCGLDDCTMSQENMRGPLVPVTTAPWRRAERRSGSRRVLWHTRDWEITLVHKYLPFRYVSQGLCSTYFLLLWKYFTVILKWCFYELYFQNVNIVYCFHCAIRSTADLESFHNHTLMYAALQLLSTCTCSSDLAGWPGLQPPHPQTSQERRWWFNSVCCIISTPMHFSE